MILSTTIPILRIFDEAKAKEFYVAFLGFSVDWEHRFGERRAGSGVAAAQAGIKAALADGARAVSTLDIVVPNTLGSNAVLVAAWNGLPDSHSSGTPSAPASP